MSHPLPSNAHQRRVKRIALRLLDLLEALDLPDRRALLPAAFAGAARRTLGEAEAVLGGGLLPPDGTRRPGDLFVSTLLNLKLISHRNRLSRRVNSR